MVRSSKWIQGTKPQQPITAVARRALHARLKAVWYYAPLAAEGWEDDIEHVHQLRVATRRARAALHIFADLLCKREARWMKRRLRELRNAAGSARDLDVFGERLQRIAEEKKGSQLGLVLEQIVARRQKTQKPLITTYKKAKRKGFKKRSRSIVKAVHWRHEEQEPTFIQAARTKLTPLVDEFFAAAAADLSDIDALHQMRIAGKQVRYAMELLAGAFEVSFRRELYATFAEVQEKLGTINDHATAIEMLSNWRRRAKCQESQGELSRLIATEEKQLDAKCLDFRGWWTAEFARELKLRFADVLSPTTSLTMEDSTLQEPMAHNTRDVETLASASVSSGTRLG